MQSMYDVHRFKSITKTLHWKTFFILDNRIDRLSSDNTQQSAYDARQRQKKDRIERIEYDVQGLNRDFRELKKDVSTIENKVSTMENNVSRILFLLEQKSPVNQQEASQQSTGHDPWTIVIWPPNINLVM